MLFPRSHSISGAEISETKSPAGPVLWQGLEHWLHHPSEPLSIDTSRYSGRTKLLVQQALDEQERIGFRRYLSLTSGLFEAPHEVPNPYNKTPQPSAWVISRLTNLRTFSKAMWIDRCTKLHNPNKISSATSDLDADIANCYANPQDRPSRRRPPATQPPYLEGPQIHTNAQNKLDLQHMPRPLPLSYREHQSAVYYTPFL
jgi:hypothetical protein